MKKATKHARYRKIFSRTQSEVETARTELLSYGRSHPIYDELGEALQAAIKATGSGKKIKFKSPEGYDPHRWDLPKAHEHLGKKVYNEISAPFKDRSNEMYKATQDRIESLKRRLDKLALLVPVRSCRRDKLGYSVDSFSALTYRSQPAAVNYARRRAEIKLDYLVEAVPEAEFFINHIGETFEVRAHVEDQLDADVLCRLLGPPLPEFVRKCWSLGVNPRVYMPLLPHGYEEEHGFDQFGKSLAARSMKK